MYEINQRICLLSDITRKGQIIEKISEETYEVLWDNEDIEIIKSTEIQIEINIQTPWARLANNLFDDYKNFTISSIINKVRNTSSNTISTLKSSKTIFKPYQFIPLLKLLNSERRRIIVADEVGLGKTISAGHIVLELASRGELKSMLVVCLNSIQEKWIDELQNKFNIRLKRFEKIQDFKTLLENARKFNDKIFGVINYDKFRQQKNIDYFEKHAIGFDLLIFDEAHALRNDTNARKSLKAFTELSNAVVMLTATPIMTSLENLYSLVKLLDEENYSNYQVFQNSININKPFIRAYNQLNAGVPLKIIAEELKSAEIESIFKYGEEEISNKTLLDVLSEDKLFQSILFELMSNENLTIAKRALIQEKLISSNSLNHFYTRTRKKEVLTEGNIVHRNVVAIEIEMSEEEEEVYETIMNETEDDIGGIQIKRKYASSLFADHYSEEEYARGIDNIEFDDNKYTALIEIIKEQKIEKLIVFAFFRKTLLYLKNKLLNDGYNTGLIYGGIDISERNKIIDDFKNDKFQILLSSEVGSTGLDMQFCNRIVN